LTIGSLENDRLFGPRKKADSVFKSANTAMRNRDALPQASRAQALACQQAVDGNGGAQVVAQLGLKRDEFEQASLIADIKIEQHVVGGKKISEAAHRQFLVRIYLRVREELWGPSRPISAR
jgi:hypothetical protein